MTTENGSADAGNPADNDGGSQNFDFGTAVEGVQDEELRGWIQNKGFDGVDKLATSYRNLEQMYGADKAGRTVIRPGDGASEDEIAQFYDALGRPESAEAYGIDAIEGADPAFANHFAGVFHEAGLNPDQAAKLVGAWGEYTKEFGESKVTEYNSNVEQENGALQKEWGAAYDQNLNVAKNAVKEFGVDGDTIDQLEQVMGFGNLMRHFHKIGSRIGDDTFENGGNDSRDGFGAMNPGQAMAKISELKSDGKFRARLMGGDKDAQAHWDSLHHMAYGKHD